MASTMGQRLLDPGTTAAILFGASDWTESGLGLAPAFRRSGKGFLRYLLDPAGLGLDPELILDLFDDSASAGDQLARLRDTLDGLLRERRDEGRPVADIIVYYVGHGTTDEQGHLTLLVRRSRKSLETETGIKAPDLARVLRVSAPQQRRMVVLDCCFAEAAARAFIGMGTPDQALAAVTAKDIADALPSRGGLLLCSSQAGEIAVGPPEAKRTLFTNALLNVLRGGAEDRPQFLTFADLCALTYHTMLSDFGAGAPRPVLHPINQPQGDLSHLPAFPNAKWPDSRADSPKAKDATRANSTLSPPSLQTQTSGASGGHGNQSGVSREERRLHRVSQWYAEERIPDEDLDFLLSIALGEQDGRLATLVLRVLDSPNATPSALFAVLKGAEYGTLIRRPSGIIGAAPAPSSDQVNGNHDSDDSRPPRPTVVDPETPILSEGGAKPAGAKLVAELLARQPSIPLQGMTLGRYEIRGTLGRGTAGTVYDGWDPPIGRRVAIKAVPLPATSDADTAEGIARFRREVQAAGRLGHPNIVAVYDYGETSELAYIVMEFVDGPSLKTLLDRGERFSVPDTVRVMDGVLEGLQFSHAHGVVHRDIKPANIMLTADGRAKIADFGIARIGSSDITLPGTVIGTPTYMSPEQFLGEPVTACTDIYSAGVLLYQLLTGERPFDGSFTSIMHKVLNTEPSAPSQLDAALPHAIDAVVLKAIAKHPQDRYSSASAFASALDITLSESFVAAHASNNIDKGLLSGRFKRIWDKMLFSRSST